MVQQRTAWQAADGKLYLTKQEADQAEIEYACDALANLEKIHLMNVMDGVSANKRTREALIYLGYRLQQIPTPAEQATP